MSITGIVELRKTAKRLAKLEGRPVLEVPDDVLTEYLQRQAARAGLAVGRYIEASKGAMIRQIRQIECGAR